MSTKEKITYQALALFSVQGYEAVTIRQIAAAVGGLRRAPFTTTFLAKRDLRDDCASGPREVRFGIRRGPGTQGRKTRLYGAIRQYFTTGFLRNLFSYLSFFILRMNTLPN